MRISLQNGSTPLHHFLADSVSELVQDYRLRQEHTNGAYNEAIKRIAARMRRLRR